MTRDDAAMRISKDAVRTIRQLVRKTAGADAQVRLFGSRVDVLIAAPT